jgi:hypothetical protein
MPAIASLEKLKAAQGDFRCMFLAVSPYALRFTSYDRRYAMPYALCTMLNTGFGWRRGLRSN